MAEDGLGALVDLVVLDGWMDGHGLPPGPIEDVQPLAGGTQNILVRFRRGGRDYVLRRPPVHLRARSNEVIRREARVLAALAGSAVPHPGLIAAEPDESVMGVVFYLMEPVEGFSPAGGLPRAYAADPAWRHRLGLAAVEGIAALGAVDHEAAGLTGYGKPDGYNERQVPRWLHELDTYGELAGYPGPEIPALDRVADWLAANVPTDWSAGIVHGDYHLANILFHHDRPEVAGILDWEMSTIGDPLVDLGWLIATFPGPDGLAIGPAAALNQVTGFPTPADLVAHYGDRSARSVASIDWYVVLACFRLGIILEGTHARACAGQADPVVGDLLHDTALALFAKADSII